MCREWESECLYVAPMYDHWNEYLLIRCVDYVELPFGRVNHD
jgi:hypothetical protein